MAQQTDKQPSVLRSIDWWTILIYLGLLIFGWVSVCGASYTYGETDIFSLDSRSGMQIVWIGTSIVLGLVILLMDNRVYDTFAYVIFAIADSDHLQSSYHQRLTIVAGLGAFACATGRVCEVCDGVGVGETDEYLRL